MPGIEKLLMDVVKKYPSLGTCRIGTYYDTFSRKNQSEPYDISGRPMQGWLNDKYGNMTDKHYMIKINENLKHADSIVKVGALAEAVSYISLRQDIMENTRGIKEIWAAITSYKDPKFEDVEKDANSKGFGRPVQAMEDYITGLENIPVITKK